MNLDSNDKVNRSSMSQVYDYIGQMMPNCRDEIVELVKEFLDTPAAYLKVKELVLLKLGGGGI